MNASPKRGAMSAEGGIRTLPFCWRIRSPKQGVMGAVLALVLVFGTTEPARAEAGCRVTGGGTVDACGPGPDVGCDPNTPGSCAPATCASPALTATHGGQVGAPVGVPTPFTPDSACIAGEWTHVRHIRKGLFGNFHARSFDSLECGCLPCPENPDVQGVVGALCNPRDRICGPEPRRAPANKICFSGPGDYAMTNGRRDRRSVVFRVDVEDRSEPGGANGPPPPDRYRMRIWFVDPDTSDGLTLRSEVACAGRDGVRPFARPRCGSGPRLLGNSPSCNRSATGYSLANEATARLVALAWKPLITGDGDRIAPWEHRLIGWAKPIITRRPRPVAPPAAGSVSRRRAVSAGPRTP